MSTRRVVWFCSEYAYLLTTRTELFLEGSPAGYEPVAPLQAAWLVRYEWTGRDATSWQLRKLLDSHPPLAHTPESPLDTVLRRLQGGEAHCSPTLILLRRKRPSLAKAVDRFAGLRPEELPVLRRPKQKTARFRLILLDQATGAPLANVRLMVTDPAGEVHRVSTNASGMVSFDGFRPGSCSVTSPQENARLEDTCSPAGPPSSKPVDTNHTGATALAPTALQPNGGAFVVAELTQHRVRTGDTLESIAQAYGTNAKQLALFNWGASDDQSVQEALQDYVGCSKRSPDGRRLQLDDADRPGVVYIAEPWQRAALATDAAHVIELVRHSRIVLSLETDEGLRIPEATFEATLADGSVSKGKLGRAGSALLVNPPPGPFYVDYLDHEDIYAKSTAAEVHHGFEQRDTAPLFGMLEDSREGIDRIEKAYDEYFNDRSGKGLLEDIRLEVTDPDALLLVEAMLGAAGRSLRSDVAVTDQDQPQLDVHAWELAG